MIRSSFIEGHHFLVARGRGYDPAEVDAVMRRLVDTLRKYEAHDPETADGATITDLEEARLARARSEEAAAETEAVRKQTLAELSDARQQATQVVTEAREEADHIRQSALADAADVVGRRNQRSEALISAALSEVKALRARALREIGEFHTSKRSEAETLMQTAELTSEKIVDDARHEAGSILGRARREHAELERRLAQLRTAASEIEDKLRSLTESTLEQTGVVASMIDLETQDLEDVVEDREPEVVRLTQSGLTIDLTDGAEDSPAESPYVVHPGPTIYQRRSGGIRERIDEAAEGDDKA